MIIIYIIFPFQGKTFEDEIRNGVTARTFLNGGAAGSEINHALYSFFLSLYQTIPKGLTFGPVPIQRTEHRSLLFNSQQ